MSTLRTNQELRCSQQKLLRIPTKEEGADDVLNVHRINKGPVHESLITANGNLGHCGPERAVTNGNKEKPIKCQTLTTQNESLRARSSGVCPPANRIPNSDLQRGCKMYSDGAAGSALPSVSSFFSVVVTMSLVEICRCVF
ncbi:uncharacterized protein V6R79_009996 [Siganus canaliculatus]